MKKILFLFVMVTTVFLFGCGDKKTDIVNTDSLKSYNAESCNKYFSTVDCIIENEIDENRTDKMREELRQSIVSQQESRSGLDNTTIENNCKAELDKLVDIEDRLKEIWCSIVVF